MEQTVKDLCFTISGVSSNFAVLGCSRVLPDELKAACRRLGAELLDLDRQLYFASFIENDAAITQLVNAIEAAADEADAVNKEIKEVTAAVKTARDVVKSLQSAAETVTDQIEKYEEAMELFKEACAEVDDILDAFAS